MLNLLHVICFRFGGKKSVLFDRSAEMGFPEQDFKSRKFSYFLDIIPHVYKVHGRD